MGCRSRGCRLICAAAVLLGLAAQPAGAALRIDTEFARAVLEEVCSGSRIDGEQIRQDPHVGAMLRHFSRFRDYFTMERYLEERQAAAHCQAADTNSFRFRELLTGREALLGQLEVVADTDAATVAALIEPWVPDGVQIDASAVIVVGSPSCGGWARGRQFFVDFPCIGDDLPGLTYLVAHEVYHTLQPAFFFEARHGDYPTMFLADLFREGSATHLADFSAIEEGGSYTELAQRAIARNARRIGENFALFDLLMQSILDHPSAESYQRAYNIGMSGSFDAPMYAVGTLIIKALENEYGAGTVTCLYSREPRAILEAYAGLAGRGADEPELGQAVTRYMQSGEPVGPADCLRMGEGQVSVERSVPLG